MQGAFKISAVALGTTIAAAAAFSVGLSNPETVIDRSFAAALNGRSVVAEAVGIGHPASASQRTASDGFEPAFLRLASHASHAMSRTDVIAPVGGIVKIGETISFSGTDGNARKYLVTDVRQISTAIGTSPASANAPGATADTYLLMVTATNVDGARDHETVVRFVFEGKADLSVQSVVKPHAL